MFALFAAVFCLTVCIVAYVQWDTRRLNARWAVYRRLHYPHLTNEQAMNIHRGPY